MKLLGHAHTYGDGINTDLIIAGKYTKTLDLNELASHCMEDLDAEFVRRVQPGDIVVAGKNFGCGSSREQAPLALKYAGISAVVAVSFARIFYRNAINVGLPVFVCDTSGIVSGEEVEIDADVGTLTYRDQTVPVQRLPAIMQEILSAGGLVEYLKKHEDYEL